MNPVSLREVIRSARARLAAAGIEAGEAALDASLLARHALGWDMARLVAHETDAPPEGFSAAFDRLVARRAGREPISSIVGRREFRGLEFEVGPDVLAPRPETEIIIEEALAALRNAAPSAFAKAPADPPQPAGLIRATAGGSGKGGGLHTNPGPNRTGCRARSSDPPGPAALGPLIVDVGTGSGCLAVALAVEFPDARIVATDVSETALAVASRNARRHRVGDRVRLVRASLLDAVRGPASLIVSNPPYIPTSDIDGLDPEVRDWEPKVALDGGSDGLDLVRALLAAAPPVLAPGGWIIMEFGFGQAEAVERLVRASPLELVRIVKDLQQIPRTVVARRAGSR